LGERAFGGMDAGGVAGEEDLRDADALRIAAGHERRPRRRADRRAVEARELHPLARHPLEVRRLLLRRPERADVAVAEVVEEQNDEVRLGGIGGLNLRAESADR